MLSLDAIPWDRFEANAVRPDVLAVVKAAALVESNAADYVAYLNRVFADDAAFCATAETWGTEEIAHGEALGRWAELADPDFDYEASFQRFRDGYRIPVDATASVRGSRAGELIARCIVETGTSLVYTSLRDATSEPVLRHICQRIAADEFRHYKLFYDSLRRYQEHDGLGRAGRLRVILGRFAEMTDDELCFAYHCANTPGDAYRRTRSQRAYGERVYPLFRRHNIQRAVRMMLKPAGLDPQTQFARWLGNAVWWVMRQRMLRTLTG